MPSIPSVSPKNVAGLGQKIIGLATEILGTVSGNEKLEKKGQLQQEAGSKRIEALKHELSADAQKAKAKGAEVSEKTAQQAKVDA